MSFRNRRTPPIRDRTPAAAAPIPQTDAWWVARHEQTLARVGQGNIDLVMIGDSITQGWGNEGRRVWDTYYGHRRAVNLGFNGDRTEHVLWRLGHGEIEGIAPNLVVLMIGTTNTDAHYDPPEKTALASTRYSRPCCAPASSNQNSLARPVSAYGLSRRSYPPHKIGGQ